MKQILENNTSIEILKQHRFYKNYIDSLLYKFIKINIPNDLQSYMQEALFPGRRLRPTLLKMFTQNQTNPQTNSILDKLCIALELCHRSSIIIDDLIDGDLVRRNSPTFFISKGFENTLLIAHYIVSEAYKIIDTLPEEFKLKTISTFTEAYNKICYGELGDIGSLKSKSYLELFTNKILLKTSALFELLFIWTAYIHDFNKSQIQLFGDIGLKIGEMYQIYNDIYDDLESKLDERGIKQSYKVNLSLMNCIILDYGNANEVEYLLSCITNNCNKEEFLKIKHIQKKNKYHNIAKQFADNAYLELSTLINEIEMKSLKNIILDFSLWLKQEKCWNQNELTNAGY